MAYLLRRNHFLVKKWSEWLWRTLFLAVSSNHCSWKDWFSIKMFHNFLFIVRKGLKSAGLKCGVRKTTSEIFWRPWDEAYLPGREVNHDHEGGSSRARLLHCTKEWLTPAISPNVGNSTSSFLLVGICVRANPFKLTVSCTTKHVRHVYLHLSSTCTATQGGAVGQLFCLFSPFWVDEKQRVQFFRFCFCKTSAETSFKELPMTMLVPVVLEAYFCGCRPLCC